MASLMDTLSGLAQQFTTAEQSGGLGGLLGGVTNTFGGQPGAQSPNGSNNSALGGLGGLLGSAALGSVFGALLTNKGVRNVAGNALVLGGGAVVATMAWKYFQKWNAGNSNPYPQPTQQSTPMQSTPMQSTPMQPTPQGIPQATSYTGSPAGALVPAQEMEQEQLAETLLMAMIFAARSDGHLDEQEKANIDMVLHSMQDGGESEKKLHTLMHRPVNPDELAARVRTREEGEDVYRLSCLIVNIDQYMERSYMDGLAKALHLNEAEKNTLERQAADIKTQTGA